MRHGAAGHMPTVKLASEPAQPDEQLQSCCLVSADDDRTDTGRELISGIRGEDSHTASIKDRSVNQDAVLADLDILSADDHCRTAPGFEGSRALALLRSLRRRRRRSRLCRSRGQYPDSC